MTNKAFIRINKVVTADQAALVAAGINPVEVNNDVSVASPRELTQPNGRKVKVSACPLRRSRLEIVTANKTNFNQQVTVKKDYLT